MQSIKSFKDFSNIHDQVSKNLLKTSDSLSTQPSRITVPLRKHQLAVLEAMKKKEEDLQRGLHLPDNNLLYSRWAVLGDKAGVGKTLMVLGFLAKMLEEESYSFSSLASGGGSLLPLLQTSLSNESKTTLFSLEASIREEARFKSLLVVPHTIYKQWQESLQMQTSLHFLLLKSARDLDRVTIIQELEEADCVLISNTLFPSFTQMLYFHNAVQPWQRIFFDEADSIKITSNTEILNAHMTWFISSTYLNLLFSNQYYESYFIRRLTPEVLLSFHQEVVELFTHDIQNHPTARHYRTQSFSYFQPFLKSSHPLRGNLVLRCSEELLSEGIQLPPLYSKIIRCLMPPTHEALQNMLPSEVEGMLHAGNIQGALETLGVSSHTPLTLVDAATAFRQKELDSLRSLLQLRQSEQAKSSVLESIQEKIKKEEEAIQVIEERVAAVSKEDTCCICFDEADAPCLTPCCSKTFCASCILQWMTKSAACPLCRKTFFPSQLLHLGEEFKARNPYPQRPTKLKAFAKLLIDNPHGKFLLFSRYDSSFHLIFEKLKSRLEIRFLTGNKDTISRTLADFEKGNIDVLCINSQATAAGMHIPAATHVVLLHRMRPEEERQILARAYRLGRTEPLHFIHLLHDRE